MDIGYDQYGPYGRRPSESRPALRLLLVAALLITAGAMAGVVLLPAGEHGGEAEEGSSLPVLGVSHLAYPATVLSELRQPDGGEWLFPATAVETGGATFVLDTGNDRILKLDTAGHVVATVGGGSGAPTLRKPMAMATDGQRIYVANSLASQIIVLDLDGQAERALTLEQGPEDRMAPRPIGVAVMPGGGLAVSDADNHRVLFLDGDGRVIKAVGTGTRSGGENGFNVPGALTVDSAGNLYVVDTLNGRVVKLSPDGAFAGEFGELGDTAGTLSRPKGVAVDSSGRVMVSDGLMAAIAVFDPDGTYLGMIGRRHAEDAASGSLFQAPAGLSLAGNTLCVTDRMAGLVKLDLSGETAGEASPSTP